MSGVGLIVCSLDGIARSQPTPHVAPVLLSDAGFGCRASGFGVQVRVSDVGCWVSGVWFLHGMARFDPRGGAPHVSSVLLAGSGLGLI